MNKKAITGSGWAWIAATFAVLLLAIFYLIGISGMTAAKLKAGPSEINVKDSLNTNLELQKSIVAFLNQRVNYDNNQITMLELISLNDLKNENAGKFFQAKSESTFNSLLSSENPSPSEYWWFRVYSKNEVPKQYPSESKFNSGGTACNPENKDENLVISQFIADKRAIFCLNKKFYYEIENSRTK